MLLLPPLVAELARVMKFPRPLYCSKVPYDQAKSPSTYLTLSEYSQCSILDGRNTPHRPTRASQTLDPRTQCVLPSHYYAARPPFSMLRSGSQQQLG